VITNPEPTALTDAYAMLKVLGRHSESREKTVSVVMNQIGSKEEALRGFDRLRGAVKRFLKVDIEYLGSVAWDETVGEATKRQVAFLTHYAGSPSSRDVRKIAARLLSASRGGTGDVGRFFKAIAEGPEGE
jgi:flagellar biosynthesis protein FlhG